MKKARQVLTEPIPQWIVNHLGRSVRLVKDTDFARAGHVCKLIAIDSGFDVCAGGPWRGLHPVWREPSRPFALVSPDELDWSILENAYFDEIAPVLQI